VHPARDQADLIEECLEARAEKDESFRTVYIRERQRREGDEDMGFFVKNVENVQGDERDHIIFSTTFGRNRHGTFKRVFGVLGQSGGERRLNVAVTRARQKVTLVTSMPLEQISEALNTGAKPGHPREFLQLYLAYASALSSGNFELAQQLLQQVVKERGVSQGIFRTVNGDGFARSVGEYIETLGWTPMPANDGSAFGIDFAVRHPKKGIYGIGIECDAHRHALLDRARAREIWRRNVMAKAIPVLHRVSMRGWYQDRTAEQVRLRTAIEAALQ
jgi:primosomal replication protein N''